MIVVETGESVMIDPIPQQVSSPIGAPDSWLDRALRRAQAEPSANPAEPVAAFNSSL